LLRNEERITACVDAYWGKNTVLSLVRAIKGDTAWKKPAQLRMLVGALDVEPMFDPSACIVEPPVTPMLAGTM